MSVGVDETVELLQALIRNRCVNDGSPDSGEERRNADVLQTYLEGAGLDVEQFTSRSDRTSVVARIEGTDASGPRLCLMGHTDVVPVNPQRWTEDPFGGEVIDGEVWGRGSLDMLCLTASMAVTMWGLARSGWRPRGDLIYFGVADEENGGRFGAEWMTDHHWDAIACDYVLTELGGFWHRDHSITIATAEKGLTARRLIISGTPGHGAVPYGADNAILTAAEVIRRIGSFQPASTFGEFWPTQVARTGLSPEIQAALLDPGRVEETLASLPVQHARGLHAGCHTTMSCNVIAGGQKFNVIPDRVVLEVDIRTLPGVANADVDRMLADVLGDLAAAVTIEAMANNEASSSPIDTPLWESLTRQIHQVFPDATVTPTLAVAATDARSFRRKGVTAYGAGLFSPAVDIAAIGSRFHGNDERIDIESLRLCTDLWDNIVRDLLD